MFRPSLFSQGGDEGQTGGLEGGLDDMNLEPEVD